MGGSKGARLGPLFLNFLDPPLHRVLSIMPKIPEISVGIQMVSQFRFLLTGIFRITSVGGPLISVEICRQKSAIPSLTNRFFALIKESGI